jgi:hypothetical protein
MRRSNPSRAYRLAAFTNRSKISIADYVEELAVSKQSFQGQNEKAEKDTLTSSAFSPAPVRGLLRKACFPNIRPVPICERDHSKSSNPDTRRAEWQTVGLCT